MEKIDALKEANSLLSRKIKSLDLSLNNKNMYKSDLLFESTNNETTLNIYSVAGGQKSEPFIENEFQRIVCIAGKINICLFNGYNEDITLESSNTFLIPPDTHFTIEPIEDSEILVVFKPKKEVEKKVLVEETIYNKV